jgi:glycosyltransferase involved in cell wall biosynthesis
VTRPLDVLLAPGVFPPDAGGPATFVPALGRALEARGHRVRVVTNGRADAGFDDRYPFDVVRIPRGERVPLRYARQVRALLGECRRFDPDVALANAFDLQTALAGRLAGVPTATKVVGDNAWERARRAGAVDDDIGTFQRRSYGPRVRGLKALRTAQTRAMDHVAVPSEYLRDLVVGWGVPRERTSVVYNAVDVDAPAVPDAERADRVVTVGRLVPWKHVGGVIDAVGRLDGVPLEVVGDGPEREALERRAERAGVGDRVTFHGRVAHERVLELVADSRCFVLNSTYEGLPHVVLEAMACGTPVVATRAGGTPEAVEDGASGLLVDPGDAAGLADAIGEVLDDAGLRDRLRAGGRDRIDERFDHGRMVDGYERLLAALAEGR